MTIDLKAYKQRDVRGLYTYYHFEAADGSFIQINYRGNSVVFQAADGSRWNFNSLEELKRELC